MKLRSAVLLLAWFLALGALMMGCLGDGPQAASQDAGLPDNAQVAPAGNPQSGFGPQTSGVPPANRSGRFGGNMTDAQRAQMQASLAKACEGKSAGDSCDLDFGSRQASGTCAELDGVLECRMQGGNGFANGTGRGMPVGQAPT